MIDLSFLTDEEQETILTVLKRDAELKKAEEQRVQRLQQMVSNKGQLKYLTGEWFYEAKQLRHQERIHGSEIIWASIKHTHKPITILELSQIAPQRPSFVSSDNKDVFVPAVLSGLLQEPLTTPDNNWDHVQNSYEQGPSKHLSPTKQRLNPFNSTADEPGCADESQTTQQSPYSQPDEYILPTDLINPYGLLQNLDPSTLIFPISLKSPLQPVPEENIESITNYDINMGTDDAGDRSNDASPKSILKHLSDTLVLNERNSAQAESPLEQWVDRKQVRFSSVLSGSSVKHDGKEVGEHSLLDVDSIAPQEEERKDGEDGTKAEDGSKLESEIKSTDSEAAELGESQQEDANDQPEKYQAQSPGPCLISATHESGKAVHLETVPEEDHDPPLTEKQLTDESSKKPSHVSPSAKQRLLGFFKRDKVKNTEAKKQKEVKNEDEEESILLEGTVPSVEAPLQTAEDRGESELNTSPEKSGPKIEGITETELQTKTNESSQTIQASLNTEIVVSNVSKSPNDHENITKSDGNSHYKLQLECSNEDTTYRAFPVLIYEDSEDSIVCSVPEMQITEPKSKQLPVALPKQLSYFPQDDKPANVCELKNFWEECSGGRASAPCSPIHSSKPSPIASPLKATGSQKRPDPISPSKIITIKSVIVNDKGFVSTDIVKKAKETSSLQDVPQSPTKSPTKRPKDQYDEVKRSPSKTCHPRVLPRETASPEGSRPASPLKTFPIVIDTEEKPRHKKSPSHEVKSNLENTETNYLSPLARSVITQDYEHYLGPHDKAHIPPFHNVNTEDTDSQNRPQSPFVTNQSGSTDPRVSCWIEQIKDFSDDTDTRAWSLSRASSGSHGEKSGPVMSALRRLSSKISSSKSLEDLTSPTREEKEHMNRSVDDVSEIPSTASFATSKKSSVSVPAFQLDETDSDSPFENNMSWRRNTGSSASNISLSSGMASMSSVSGSMTSINHMDLGDVDVQGTIQFAVNYIQKLGEFHIFVVHCRDLAVGDAKKSRSDPYVKCYLLPDKTKLGKRKTTIKKKTLNPTYNEILRFKILLEVLKSQHLNVSVWHNDTFGRNSFLGEVDLDLSEWDFSNAQINEYALKARTASLALTSNPSPTRTSDIRGQMRVALRFLPQASPSRGPSRNETGEVQIWVKDCKNLPPIRGVIIDPFVKCTVLPDTSRKSRQKTRVVKRTANPMFNHTMVYDGFRPEDLREACVELTVWDHDRLNNHYIGGVRLGRGSGKSYGVDVNWMDSTTSEANLWQRMLESVGEWVEDVLPLRMLLMAKSMAK
ncbi:synaptotagmin-like protein 2 isoform X1 [Periophthalmus magnuspinnatus]|uniref:synaptotagmin-like protein 2 isoform X1 n=1 Tax=Periophthalmus magnuspinnatus TaxID=409849 RepID=UPI002436BE8B|nr:synaptotagmin-like protein 2 isoform X1 [Periophthalmus magnuspinnatus]